MCGIAQLPFDVLLVIFEAGYLASSDVNYLFELQISQVNRLWHHLAIRLPRLWTRIGITQMPRRTLKAYLERSRSYPLDVHLNLGFHHEHASSKVQIAAAHISRWRSLTISTIYFYSLIESISCLRSLHAPILHRISILSEEVHNYYYDDDDRYNDLDNLCIGDSLWIFDRGAPCLTTLDLSGVRLGCCRFPMATLTCLSVDSRMTKTVFIVFMRAMPNLRELSFKGDFIPEWQDPPSAVVDAPSLCILRIWGIASRILSALSCPKCHTLVLLFVHDHSFEHTQSTSLATQYPVLRSLVLVSHDLSAHSSFTFLAHAFPVITHFGIVEQWGSDSVPQILTKSTSDSGEIFWTDLNGSDSVPQILTKSTSDSGEIFWPDLNTLTLSSINVHVLRAIVKHRVDIGRPLRKLRLMGVNPPRWDEIPETAVLKSEITVEEVDAYERGMTEDDLILII